MKTKNQQQLTKKLPYWSNYPIPQFAITLSKKTDKAIKTTRMKKKIKAQNLVQDFDALSLHIAISDTKCKKIARQARRSSRDSSRD